MAVLDRAEQLPEALFGGDGVHAIGVALKILQDGTLDELEHEVELTLAPEDLNQVDDVVVLELL